MGENVKVFISYKTDDVNIARSIAEHLMADGIDVWFSDESGFCGDPTPRYMIAKKGAKLKIPYYGAHIRSNVIGAVKV